MNYILSLTLLFACVFKNVYSSHIFRDNILKLKNNALKRLIRDDIKNFRLYLTRIRSVNNQILTKYYDSIYTYMSLSEDDKVIVDYLVSLSY
jgi:hypothetical protein